MDIKIADFLGTRLQGEPKGTKDFGRMCDVLSGVAPGELITLDFAGVEVATASWMSAMLLPLFRWSADDHIDLYFVLRNGLKAEWLSDLKLVARYNEYGFLVSGPEAAPAKAVLIGALDEAHQKTLAMVSELGEATGAELERRRPDQTIRATAWNNRLRKLYDQRLLRRTRRGREKVYTPVVRMVTSHG